jgi:hypothetical protein
MPEYEALNLRFDLLVEGGMPQEEYLNIDPDNNRQLAEQEETCTESFQRIYCQFWDRHELCLSRSETCPLEKRHAK